MRVTHCCALRVSNIGKIPNVIEIGDNQRISEY